MMKPPKQVQQDAQALKEVADKLSQSLASQGIDVKAQPAPKKQSYEERIKQRHAAKRVADQARNQAWDDLKQLYAECSALLLSHVHIGLVLKNSDLMSYVKDVTELSTQIQILSRSITDMHAELRDIYVSHQEMSGTCKEEDLLRTLNIFVRYNDFKDKVVSVINPIAAYIATIVIDAEVEKNRQMAASSVAAQQPQPETQQ